MSDTRDPTIDVTTEVTVERVSAERDEEAWYHAACWSIATGIPGWEGPLPGRKDSRATAAVRALRVRLEEAQEALAAERAERPRRWSIPT